MVTSIFNKPLREPKKSDKVYPLEDEEVAAILKLRGVRNELDPGMGGVSPKVLDDLLGTSSELVSVDLALTSGCNFKCEWCYRPGEEWGNLRLDFDTVSRVVEQSADLGAKFVILTGGEPLLYKSQGRDYFDVVDKVKETYDRKGIEAKVLTFTDVALIDKKKAEMLADKGVALCLKRDTLDHETQDLIVGKDHGVKTGSKEIEWGYENLFGAGYGSNPELAVSVNTVLAKNILSRGGNNIDTLRGAIDLHRWVKSHGMEHSIVPIHYCGEALEEEQAQGIHPLDVKVLYDILSTIDGTEFGDPWVVHSAFPKNKTCNRPGRGVHIRATGKVTSCSESPLLERYLFGDVSNEDFGDIIRSDKFQRFSDAFSERSGKYICNPDACDLNANHLCRGGCATRSAFTTINPNTGLIDRNKKVLAYDQGREDPLCPGWVVLAQKQGALKEGLYEGVAKQLLDESGLDPEVASGIRDKIVTDFNSLRNTL